MKNRALLLAMQQKIMTVEEYALKLGFSNDRAELILKQQAILTNEEIKRNCDFFGVSSAYFLCIIE